jgi:hypothetical protein
VALGFLLKAFLTRGLECLLWNMTAIEAAIGEPLDGGVTRILRERTAKILAGAGQEATQARRSFNELYDFRSALVHGKTQLPEKEIYLGHLGQARNMARGVVCWMLNYLAHIADSLDPGTTSVPSREDLLALLDLDPQTIRETTAVLRAVPPEFPHVKEWA